VTPLHFPSKYDPAARPASPANDQGRAAAAAQLHAELRRRAERYYLQTSLCLAAAGSLIWAILTTVRLS
jgi:hypothetical protein